MMASSEGEFSIDTLRGQCFPQNGSSDMESPAITCPLALPPREKTVDSAVSRDGSDLAKGDCNFMVNGTSDDAAHMEVEYPIEEPKMENCASNNQKEDENMGKEKDKVEAMTVGDLEQNEVDNVNSSLQKDEKTRTEDLTEKDEDIQNGIGSEKDKEITNEDVSEKDKEMTSEDVSENDKEIVNKALSEKEEEMEIEEGANAKDKEVVNEEASEKDKEIKNVDASEKDKEIKNADTLEKGKAIKNEDVSSVDEDVVITSCEEKTPKVSANATSRPANDIALTGGPIGTRNTRSSTLPQVKVAPQYPALSQPKLGGMAEAAASKMSCSGPNYRPVAKLLISIGLELVREGVIKNLIDIQAEKDKLQKLDAKEKTQLEKLEDSWKSIVRKNEVYRVPVRRCQCTFSAFTQTTLDFHRQFGRSTRPGRYRCCYCSRFKTHIPAKFITHMNKEHHKFARLQPMPLLQCPFCPFEHKQATHLERHVNSCQKKFTLSRNLQFTQNVFDIPVFETKPRPMQGPLLKPQPYVGFPRPSGLSGLAGMPNQGKISSPAGVPNPATGLSVTDILSACGLSPQIQAQVLSNLSIHSPSVLGRGPTYSSPRPGFPTPSASRQPMTRPNMSAGNWMQMAGVSRAPVQSSPRMGGMNLSMQQQRHLEQLTRGMQRNAAPLRPVVRAAPMPVLGHPVPVARRAGSPATRVNHVQFPRKCEICDLPMDKLESLRLHLVTVHREPLDSAEFHRKGQSITCHVCAETFYTKQGALRHYQVHHGATVPRPYHCIKCGAKVVTSILNHLSSQHNITVLDMYEAKFCMLCNQRLKSLNLFESHVVSEHADIFPNRLVLLTMIKALNAASLYKTMGKPDLGPMRPLPPGFPAAGQMYPRGMMEAMQVRPVKGRPKEKFPCQSCCIQFATAEELAFHCEKDHMFKCSRCYERWSSLDLMHRHFMSKHHNEKDPCILCGEAVQIGRPTVRHIKRMHIRSCSVVVPRLRPQEAMRYLVKRRRPAKPDAQHPGCSTAARPLFPEGNVAGDKTQSEREDPVSKVEEIMEVDGETIVIETNR